MQSRTISPRHRAASLALLALLPMLALGDDSLQAALDAVTRRQRDLALPAAPTGYFALSQYRQAPADEDQLAFLQQPPREFAGDGQPENIGYGYQKTISSGPMAYPAQLIESSPPQSSPNMIERVLLNYLKDEYLKENEPDGNYYQQVVDGENKRSLFRERGNDVVEQGIIFDPNIVRQYDELAKRENMILPSSFRERMHGRSNLNHGMDPETMRHQLIEMFEKEMEDTNDDERMERKRLDSDENNDQGEEYLNLLQNLWERYKQEKPQVLNIEDLTQNDVQEILSSLNGETPAEREVLKTEARKRQYNYGSGFDFFNNAGAMGNWGSGSGGFGKRNKQRVDGAGQQGNNFLYSLKFISPVSNRESVETLRDEEGIEVPDERDEDILRLASGFSQHEPEAWPQIYEHATPLDEVYGPDEESYQKLIFTRPQESMRSMSQKRLSFRDPPTPAMMLPGRNLNKRFIFENKRKRYPVTKRSSNFYASPPLLHHKGFASDGLKDSSKKKDVNSMNGATDPKVAQELNQIFSSSANSEDPKDVTQEQNSHINEQTTASPEHDSGLKHETTTYPSVTTTILTGDANHNSHFENNTKDSNNDSSVRSDRKNHSESHTHREFSHSNKESVEPMTMSRIQTPLEIKKKSIDWSDYFGIDRRRKKTGSNIQNKVENAGDENGVDDNWLLNQYYKTLAMVSNPLKKRTAIHSHETDSPRDENQGKLFDTRNFETNLFARSAQREAATKKSSTAGEDSRIDNVDSKLRNMEDLIVNEAVKYTGSHEGTEDPKEIQDIKDKIMSRLAAAYSLEKMRLALAEFKSSLQAQMMSRYNPENQRSFQGNAGDESKMKRVAVKKEKAEEGKTDVKDEEKKKRNGNLKGLEDQNLGDFLDGRADVEPMSEGYMGSSMVEHDTGCPVLDQILQRCKNVGTSSDDHGQVFLPLCSLHQICNLCGPEVGSPSASACDIMFLTEADSMCQDDMTCQRTARRIATILRRGPDINIAGEITDHCSNDSCLAQYFLTSPIPYNEPR